MTQRTHFLSCILEGGTKEPATRPAIVGMPAHVPKIDYFPENSIQITLLGRIGAPSGMTWIDLWADAL